MVWGYSMGKIPIISHQASFKDTLWSWRGVAVAFALAAGLQVVREGGVGGWGELQQMQQLTNTCVLC